MSIEEYRPIVAAGAEGLVVYQETYDRAIYDELHTAGPKRDFNARLATVERGYAAGFRRLAQEFRAVLRVVHFEHDLGDDSGVRLVGYVDDIRVPVR